MASPELSSRLRYLNDSAHLLATTAPATSRYLMSSCNTLMFERNIEQSEAQRRNICGACGTIMVLGWDGTIQLESQSRRKRNNNQKDEVNRSKSIVYKCESCNRTTRFPIPLPTPRNRLRSLRQTPSAGAGVTSTARAKASPNATAPLSTNASSKKRAKARKQSGLEAILARKKSSEASASGFGLNLMDFMNKA
jgi:ribonuclease MRP protein subunit SNM1